MPAPGVYIQVPFCESKCSFCNFSSQVARQSLIAAYADALVREIERLPESLEAGSPFLSNSVDTIYFGGGTPPILGDAKLREIVRRLRDVLDCTTIAEFTIEATPGSADLDFLRVARSLGVNRLSVGAQSFDDRELRAVGRLHTAEESCGMVRAAENAGFENISLDLIAGLPYQTRESWKKTLETALELRPQHVSVYLFEVDEKSRLGAEVLRHGSRYHAESVPDDEFMAEAYETARDRLREAGYRQYEISNFALPGFESRHNQKYWRMESYLGLGAGAHSFDGRRRWANEISPEAYIRKVEAGEIPAAEEREPSPGEQLEEFFFLGLRQCDGVDLAAARARWGGEALVPWEGILARFVRDGLLEREGSRVRLAARAYLVSNEIFEEFVGV
jgi:oxygen-independent coproporphyrinogen-3 oxidase